MVTDAIDSCTCGEGKLERCTTGLHHRSKLSGQRFRNKTSEHCSCCNAPDATSGLLNAVILADMNALNTQRGTAALAKSSAAAVNRAKDSWSSRQTFRISLEHPPGPGEHPVGALLKHSANIFASNFNSRSGQNSRMSAGMSRTQRILIPRRQRSSHQLLTGPRHLPLLHLCSSVRPALFVVPRFRWCCGILNGVHHPFPNHDAPNQPNDLADNPKTFAPIRSFQVTQRLGVCATTWSGSKRTTSKLGFLPSMSFSNLDRRSLNAMEKA